MIYWIIEFKLLEQIAMTLVILSYDKWDQTPTPGTYDISDATPVNDVATLFLFLDN